MTETLSHPDSGMEPDGGAPAGTSRWQKVVGIVGLLVVLWVGNNMYDTVTGDLGGGPGGGHGPGKNAPVENQDQEPDTDDVGGHTPPAGGHG